MPARANRSRRSSTGGRVTPKGTRPTNPDPPSAGPPGGPKLDRSRYAGTPDRGVRPNGFRPPAPRSGTRGNR